MIRDAIARHAGGHAPLDPPGSPFPGSGGSLLTHSSHGMLAVAAVGEGECIIEPSVRCDHCGYCQSLGH